MILACVLVALTAPAHAQPDDARARAGAAFKRAVAAEQRKDWRTAIREYEAAYQASPHPDVLYNIAGIHERLGELRTAAGYYQRYLDDKPDADDRAKVIGKLAELRARPSVLRVTSTPAGATISVDGQPRGAAPLELTVSGGAHQLAAEAGGVRRAAVVTAEYGEPQDVALVLAEGRGTLVVDANAPHAQIAIDGQVVGTTPWTGQVAAGTHALVVTADGYTTTERTVEVPADGTAQIRAALGRPIGYVEPAPPARSEVRGALESGARLGRGYTIGLAVTYRTAGRRAEVATGVQLGSDGVAWALRGRLFALTGPVRPYAVAALDYGITGGAAGFVGGGLMVAPSSAAPFHVHYYVESGYGVHRADGSDDAFVPIVVGFSYGR